MCFNDYIDAIKVFQKDMMMNTNNQTIRTNSMWAGFTVGVVASVVRSIIAARRGSEFHSME